MDASQRAAIENAALALMRAGNYRGAEVRLRTMLGHDANDARALALLARCRFEDNDKTAGMEMARAASSLDPEDPLVKSVLTLALQRAGKTKQDRDEQLQLAEDATAEAPEDSEALFNLAIARQNSNAHRKATGLEAAHHAAAIRDLIDDAERFASDPYDLINIASVRLRRWDYSAAETLARRAMLLDPAREEPFEILAECALARKLPVEAYELALEALGLSPGNSGAMRLLTRARARSRVWLRPFVPGIDWIVEMDRRGLVVMPVLMAAIGIVFAISLNYDLQKIASGRSPAIIISAASGGALLYASVSYIAAVLARLHIRRDLRRISLPDF